MKIPHIADTKLKQALKVVVNNFISGCLAVEVRNPHLVLFCLIPGKDDDLFWCSHLTGQKAPDQYFAQ